MAGLVPAIHALLYSQGVDARHKAGHDAGGSGVMMARRTFVLIAALLTAFVHPAAAQSYPSRVIKLVVPFTPGSPNDVNGTTSLMTRLG